MKKMVTILVPGLIPIFLFGQMINNFDSAPPDTNYWMWYDPIQEGGQSSTSGHYATNTNADADSAYIHVSYVSDPLSEGAGAMQVEYSVHNMEGWGGYTKIHHFHPDTLGVYDWSAYESISFDYYNSVAQSLPNRVTLRLNLNDYGGIDDSSYTGLGEFYYSFISILDDAPGWNTVTIPLINGEGTYDPTVGFNLTGWAGNNDNGELDTDAIHGFTFEFSISANNVGDPPAPAGDRSYGTIVLDNLRLTGYQGTELVFFNGLTTPADVELYGGWSGSGSASISYGTGINPDNSPNSILWNTPTNPFSDEWGLFFIDRETNPRDLGAEWSTDSLKFSIKADAGFGDLYVILFDADQDGFAGGTEDIEMTAQFVVQSGDVGYDGTWKNIIIPLASFNRFSGGWDPSQEAWIDGEMDSTKIGGLKFQVSSVSDAGIVVHFDNLWTDNPEFDVIAPNAPGSVGAELATYYNLVTWADVSGESGEFYHVYASMEPIIDESLSNVDVVATNVLEGEQIAAHYIFNPLEDASVSYYYAVVCKDAAGNLSELGTSDGTTTNIAKGIPTISLDPPTNFVADGNLSEWYDSGIMPFVINPTTGHVAFGVVTDENDLSGTVYMAIDDDYLYVAVDVIDDEYFYGAGNWWDQDAFQLFIGLYDWRGEKHGSITRGDEPDYIVYMNEITLQLDNPGNTMMQTPDSTDYYFEGYNPDYAAEGKISLDILATRGEDTRFHPLNGMRIPIDLYFHDNDGSGWEGNIGFSHHSTDQQWNNPGEWAYTWVGDRSEVVSIVDGEQGLTADQFALYPNYPNPFNPSTTIRFTLPEDQLATLRVFNLQGQMVETLVNERLSSGTHSLEWNAGKVASGMYFYQLQSHDKTMTQKMILMK
ncbi:uncharacterized protein METZ01_LOCUS96451 [marine metagenome]|uniref:Secretion system C-terminal sorting domain-containing protein n=1 Tax=marine metagenome TaxID=408172 RepID=A0A381VVE7_9ZZZZ